MGLKTVARNGVEVIFSVLKDAVKESTHKHIYNDGWGDSTTTTETVRVILDRFRKEDVETLSFSDMIQPTDSKALIPQIDVELVMDTSGTLVIAEDEFTIIALELDPFEVLYTLLIRKV